MVVAVEGNAPKDQDGEEKRITHSSRLLRTSSKCGTNDYINSGKTFLVRYAINAGVVFAGEPRPPGAYELSIALRVQRELR
jgi:hypothetical protein